MWSGRRTRLRDEEAAHGGKQVGVLCITWVVERNAAIGDRQWTQQDRGDGRRLVVIRLEPPIVAIACSRGRDTGKLDLQFIHDALVTGLPYLTTTNKEGVSGDGLTDELIKKTLPAQVEGTDS